MNRIKSNHDLELFVKYLDLNPQKLVTINQIHSSNIISAQAPGNYDSYDGVINFKGKLVCSIKVADCLPIFLINKVSKTIGIVHAGWRGLSFGIIDNCVKKMIEETKETSNYYAIVGPSIQKCCFKIKKDVLKYFDRRFISKINQKHYKVDLQYWAFNQLLENKLKKENIYISKSCTFCEENKYHSFRRDGLNSGRMYAILGWSS